MSDTEESEEVLDRFGYFARHDASLKDVNVLYIPTSPQDGSNETDSPNKPSHYKKRVCVKFVPNEK
jgi:hypothetical protein